MSNSSFQLSKNFNSDEFICPCLECQKLRHSGSEVETKPLPHSDSVARNGTFSNCGASGMDLAFINKLQYARDVAGIPFHINSGFRCIKHNREVGGSDHSSHLLGIAADIRATTSRERGLILPALYHAGFTRIGVSKTFLHCDTDIHKEQNVTWL